MMTDAEYASSLLILTTLIRGLARIPLDDMSGWVTTMETFDDLDAEMTDALTNAGRIIAASQFLVSETCRGAGL